MLPISTFNVQQLSDFLKRGVGPPRELIRSAEAGDKQNSSHALRMSDKLNIKTKVHQHFRLQALI
ncbi:hypothetical protein BDR03DRAFT_940772 [Suillus americanus]|nr:hypothetical protein BDR03DRAFT_940772 [Suillus americanus]